MIFVIAVVTVLGIAVFMPVKTAVQTKLIPQTQTQTAKPKVVANNNIVSHPNPVINTGVGRENEGEGNDDFSSFNGTVQNNSIVTQPPAPTSTPSTTITATQVATHNNASDCWLIISGSVYDVTNFLAMHSGGPGQIIPYCGQDATVAFDTKGGRGSHSQNAVNILSQYYVGTLAR